MDRRKFLKLTGAGATALVVAPAFFVEETVVPEPEFIWEMIGARQRTEWAVDTTTNYISSYIPGNEKLYSKMEEIFQKHKEYGKLF